MTPLKISIVLPFPVTKPVGGAKIMYEYANRLCEKGHQVAIYHSIKRPFKKSKTPVQIKQAIFFFRGVARPKWFQLHKNIISKIVPEISDKYLQNADIVFSTWWQMAYAINSLSASKGKKFNLIQDYENWGGHEAELTDSFKLPINHLVISRYLQKLVEEKSGKKPVHLPNAIDTEKFSGPQKSEAAGKDPLSIIMLYSEEPRKGTADGLDALKPVQQKYPELKAVLFGVYPAPADLPVWIKYYQKPADLNDLYSKSAIFLSPSLAEGWALPPAEAMACGCAVVCTDIGGHADYAVHGKTALLVQPENINDMAEKIIMLIDNPDLLHKIAAGGYKLITSNFSWNKSLEILENSFYNSLKN